MAGPSSIKQDLRRRIRRERAAREQVERVADGVRLAQVARDIPALTQASCVAAYVSRPAEPMTDELLTELHQRGVRVLLPALAIEGLAGGMGRGWAEFAGMDDLVEAAPGRPLEPSGANLGADAIAQAQVVLVPALAVDTAGTRLGQGGGWYDRALALAAPDALILAVVHGDEVYDASTNPLPKEKHDLTVHGIVTPDGWQMLPAQAGNRKAAPARTADVSLAP